MPSSQYKMIRGLVNPGGVFISRFLYVRSGVDGAGTVAFSSTVAASADVAARRWTAQVSGTGVTTTLNTSSPQESKAISGTVTFPAAGGVFQIDLEDRIHPHLVEGAGVTFTVTMGGVPSEATGIVGHDLFEREDGMRIDSERIFQELGRGMNADQAEFLMDKVNDGWNLGYWIEAWEQLQEWRQTVEAQLATLAFGVNPVRRAVTAGTTAVPGVDGALFVSTTLGAVGVTLQTPVTGLPGAFTIKKTTTDTNAITLTPASGQIEGGATLVFGANANRDCRRVEWDGTNWWITAAE